MINLLPNEVKKQMRAARTNVTLLKYLFLLGCASAFLLLACSTSYVFIIANKPKVESNIKTDQTESVAYDAAKTQLNSFTTSFLNAKSILDQQVSYSNIITEIGAALPSGAIIENLSIVGSNLDSPISLQVKAKSADDASKIKDNLQKSAFFKDPSIQSVAAGQDNASDYSVTIIIKLTINKGVSQ